MSEKSQDINPEETSVNAIADAVAGFMLSESAKDLINPPPPLDTNGALAEAIERFDNNNPRTTLVRRSDKWLFFWVLDPRIDSSDTVRRAVHSVTALRYNAASKGSDRYDALTKSAHDIYSIAVSTMKKRSLMGTHVTLFTWKGFIKFMFDYWSLVKIPAKPAYLSYTYAKNLLGFPKEFFDSMPPASWFCAQTPIMAERKKQKAEDNTLETENKKQKSFDSFKNRLMNSLGGIVK